METVPCPHCEKPVYIHADKCMYCQKMITWHERKIHKRAFSGFVLGIIGGIILGISAPLTLVLTLVGFFLCYDLREERFGLSGVIVNAAFFFVALFQSGLYLIYQLL